MLLGQTTALHIPVAEVPDLPQMILDALARQPADATLSAPCYVSLGGLGLINAAAVTACVRTNR